MITTAMTLRAIAPILAILASSLYLGYVVWQGLLVPTAASANTAPSGSFTLYTLDGDSFYTWDFITTSLAADKVDWPVRFLFRQNADVDKVKDRLDGIGGDPSISPQLDSSGGAMWGWVYDGPEDLGGNHFDSDEGKKQGLSCSWDHHMRIYAEAKPGVDRNYNASFGYYVVASIHADYEWLGSGFPCSPQYQSFESDEDWWRDRIDDHLTNSPYNWTWADFHNYFDNGNGNVVEDIGGGNHKYAGNGFPVTVWVAN